MPETALNNIVVPEYVFNLYILTIEIQLIVAAALSYLCTLCEFTSLFDLRYISLYFRHIVSCARPMFCTVSMDERHFVPSIVQVLKHCEGR